jgi:hypothetical protein
MSFIATSSMILPGPKVGSIWDAVLRDCARALLIVKPGQEWRRRDDPDQHDALTTYPNRKTVVSIERYTLDGGFRVGGKALQLVEIKAKDRNGRERAIRADRFLRLFVPVEAVEAVEAKP